MHYLKKIFLVLVVVEFIGVSLSSLMLMIPSTMIEGRIAMFIWVACIMTAAIALYIQSNKEGGK